MEPWRAGFVEALKQVSFFFFLTCSIFFFFPKTPPIKTLLQALSSSAIEANATTIPSTAATPDASPAAGAAGTAGAAAVAPAPTSTTSSQSGLVVKSSALHPVQPLLFFSASDSTLRVWDVEQQQDSICAHTAASTVMAVSRTSRVLLSSPDYALNVWHVQGGKAEQQTSFLGHTDRVTSIQILETEKAAPFVASGSFDGTVRFWHLPGDDNEAAETKDIATSNNSIACETLASYVTCLATLNNTCVAAGCDSGLIALLGISSENKNLTVKRLKTLHAGLSVQGLACVQEQLVSLQADGKVALWTRQDVPTPIKLPALATPAHSIASTTGDLLAVVTPSGTAELRVDSEGNVDKTIVSWHCDTAGAMCTLSSSKTAWLTHDGSLAVRDKLYAPSATASVDYSEVQQLEAQLKLPRLAAPFLKATTVSGTDSKKREEQEDEGLPEEKGPSHHAASVLRRFR